MKKHIKLPAFFGLFSVVLLLLACSQSDNSIAQVSSKLPNEKDETANLLAGKDNLNKNSATPETKLNLKPDEKIVWYGSISKEQLKGSDTDDVWIGNDENPKYNRIGMTTDVDILNCAGFLMSGKMHKIEDYGWQFKVIPKTIAVDAAEKVMRCYATTAFGNNSEDIFSGAFAVAPQNINRKNIEIGKFDTAKIFSSLPKDTKIWLNEEKVFYKTESAAKFRRKDKQNLSLKEGDDWTDIDGDGEIDLVYVASICSAEDEEGDNCGRILMRVNGKWKQIGLIQKA